MPYCMKCGLQVGQSDAYCTSCGAKCAAPASQAPSLQLVVMVFEVDNHAKRTMSHGLVMTTKFGKISLVLILLLVAFAIAAAVRFAGSPIEVGSLEMIMGLYRILLPLVFASVLVVALRIRRKESTHLTDEQLRIEGGYLTYSYHRKRYDPNPRGLDVVVANLPQCQVRYDEKERKVVISGDIRWHHYSDIAKEALIGLDQMKPMAELRIYPYFKPDLLTALGLHAE